MAEVTFTAAVIAAAVDVGLVVRETSPGGHVSEWRKHEDGDVPGLEGWRPYGTRGVRMLTAERLAEHLDARRGFGTRLEIVEAPHVA